MIKIKKKSKKENKINRKSEEESVESKELYLSLKYKDNMEKCLSYLESYLNGLNLTDLNNIITEKNLDIFQKLSDVENIQISLLLTKIYNKIFGAEDLYTNFFSDEDEEENEKLQNELNNKKDNQNNNENVNAEENDVNENMPKNEEKYNKEKEEYERQRKDNENKIKMMDELIGQKVIN